MLPIGATRAVCLVHRARHPCTAPSCLHATFTLTFVVANTHDNRYNKAGQELNVMKMVGDVDHPLSPRGSLESHSVRGCCAVWYTV